MGTLAAQGIENLYVILTAVEDEENFLNAED